VSHHEPVCIYVNIGLGPVDFGESLLSDIQLRWRKSYFKISSVQEGCHFACRSTWFLSGPSVYPKLCSTAVPMLRYWKIQMLGIFTFAPMLIA
jgi:hypothetical protein